MVVLLLGLCACANGEKTPLHFFYMTTKTGFFRASAAGIPVVDLALEQINNRSDILTNYSLSYTTILDSKVRQHLCLSPLYVHIYFSVMPLHLWMLFLSTSEAIQT